MPTLTGRTHEEEIELIECSPHSRLPRLDLGVDWESPWREFRTSVRDFFTGPRPQKESEAQGRSVFRVDWVRGKLPAGAFTASSLWHVAIVMLLILPIWGFLPATQHNLAPVHIDLTYLTAQDLPPISLPGSVSKPSPAGDPAKPLPQLGADAYHHRQTILSTPVTVTHPRQTLIQPDAPSVAPKIDAPLPNIVQWSAPAPARPQLQFSASAAAPKVRQRSAQDVAAPDDANNEKNLGPLNIAATPIANSQPQMPISPMAAASTPSNSHRANQDAGAAPEVGSSANGDAVRVIALSAAPAPPAPEVNVPVGNSAARVAISPDGKQPDVPGGAPNGVAGNGSTGGGANAMGGTNGAGGSANGSGGGGGANSLPAAVSVSGGANPHAVAGGGIGAPGSRPGGKLNLKLAPSSEPMAASHRTPVDVSRLDPSEPPEKILSGKAIYPMHVNMPNLTSIAGSWILNCAQLDDGGPGYRQAGAFSGPVPIDKVDPKYPQALIEKHVDGEVVLYAIIRKDGSVDNIQLVRKLDPQLDKYSMEAFSRWKFRPGMRAGVPVDVEAVVHIPFRFRNPNDQ